MLSHMRKPAALVLMVLGLVVASIAFAQTRKNGELLLGDGSAPAGTRVKGGLVLDSASVADGGRALFFSGKGTAVYDFPSLGGTMSALDIVCAEIVNAGTAEGCRFGDQVLLGVDQVLPNAFGNINAYVSAADSFKVRACASGITDAGSFNMPDASYTVRCIR